MYRKDARAGASSVDETGQFPGKNWSASSDTGIGPACGLPPGLVTEGAEYACGLPPGLVTEGVEYATKWHGEVWAGGGAWRRSTVGGCQKLASG